MSHCGSSHEMRSQCVQMQTYPGFILKGQTRFCLSPCGQAFHTHEDMSPQSGPKAIEMALGPSPPITVSLGQFSIPSTWTYFPF